MSFSYADAIQFLYGLQLFGTKLGLENPRKLAALGGDPQQRLRFIHVAGTNGKGSVCAMLESVYRAAGLRVGLFTSPHLVSFGERIQVNRQLIAEADVARLVAAMQERLKAFPAESHPTFFEVVAVMALEYFAGQKCDLVIWETGMGGRLDATNIVTPMASVITNIALDHQAWLGETLAKIAFEKAGIIKPGVPVITAPQLPEPMAVLAETARQNDAPLVPVASDAARAGLLQTLTLPLRGEHQRLNAAVALAVVQTLQSQMSVSEAAIRHGLETVHWPGRLQLLTIGRRRILLDGAHNPAGMQILVKALRENLPNEERVLILGVLADKDYAAMCRRIAPLARRICLVPIASARSAAPAKLAPHCQAANATAEISVHPNLAEALEKTADCPFVIITGSLYLVGEALEQLHDSSTAANERGLNEWGTPRNGAGA